MAQQPISSSQSITLPRDYFDPVGSHTQNSSLSSAQTLTKPAGASRIFLQALTQNIRVTLDGTTPTASKGFQVTSGEYIVIPFGGTAIKVIEESASASIEYQWLK